MPTPLLELECGDDPAVWADLGFAVEAGGACRLGTVTLRLDGAGGGLRGWTLGGEGPAAIAGIPTTWGTAREPATAGAHPNGASSLDHVVILTGSRDATVRVLVAAGGDLRRSGGPPQLPAPIAFVRLGPVIVEVAETPSAGGARLWGVVAVVPDVDAYAAEHPGLVGAPRPAVQPGRRIATAAPRPGLATALAFITPR